MISKKAAGLTPYVAGEQPQDKKYIKLNTNENPYPPSGKVSAALKAVDVSRLRLYPDPESSVLCETVAKAYGLNKGNVFCGNGSDEILAFCFQAFFDPDAEFVYFPDITYSFYPVWCNLYNIKYKTPALDKDFTMKAADYIGNKDCRGVVIANPNAPTGKEVSINDIGKIAAANKDCVVIVDEAYIDFGGETAIPLIKEYKNICVVRTFSKSYSLAGMRAGFAVADEKLINALKTIKDSFNSYPLDTLAQTAAAAAFTDTAYFIETVNKVIKTREAFIAELKKLSFTAIPSSANFIFASHNRISAETLYQDLKENGVLVRFFKKPRIDNFLRITIGTDEEMQECVRILIQILGLK